MADTIAAKQRNEAAERLLERVKAATGIGGPWSDKSNWDRLLDAALAAERTLVEQECVERGHLTGADIHALERAARRATVERIRTQIHGQVGERLAGQKHVGLPIVDRILDEEAAR